MSTMQHNQKIQVLIFVILDERFCRYTVCKLRLLTLIFAVFSFYLSNWCTMEYLHSQNRIIWFQSEIWCHMRDQHTRCNTNGKF